MTERQKKLVENYIRLQVKKTLNETNRPLDNKNRLKEGKTKYARWTPQSNIKKVGGTAVSEFVRYGFRVVFPEEWLQDNERDWADSIWFKLPSKLPAAQLKFLLGTQPDESGMEDGYFSLWWD